MDETALLEHIPKHKESKHLKTHICQFCGKSYTQETYLAKHMQKHSDRPDKSGRAGGGANLPTGQATGQSAGSGGGQSGQNNAAATAAAVGAAALTSMTAAGQGSQLGPESAYWPKMDPAAYGHLERDYGSLMDPRLNPHARDMVDPR